MRRIVTVLTILSFISNRKALIVEGILKTEKDWVFLTRFCYQTDNGKVEFYFEFPSKLESQSIVLYYDGQWPDVYPQKDMSCFEKLAVTNPKNFQILTLTAKNPVFGSGCELNNIGDMVVCQGTREIRSVVSRWWYLAVSRCGYQEGIDLKYRMTLTNGESFWNKHFSADEKNILQTDIFFLVAFIIIIFFSLYVAYILSSRQLLHTTYKLYLWTLLFEFFSIIVNIAFYSYYGHTGKPRLAIKSIARGCHCISDVIFVVLLILLGKGWTVTRGKISASGQVKLSVFCTFYAISYVALFIYEAKAFDPGVVLYIYESPAGVGICVLKVIAWLWFCYGIFFTLKNYAEKRDFYYPFWIFYTKWFLSGPIVVMLATYMLDAYIRAQVVNAVERSVAMVSSLFFLVITRPSASNKNFPYHVRTSQIGIIDESNHNFEHRAYIPKTEEMKSTRNVSALFSASSFPGISINGLSGPTDSTEETGFANLAYNDDYFRRLKPSNQYQKTLVNGDGDLYPGSLKAITLQQQQQPHQQQRNVIYRADESLSQMFRASSVEASRTPTQDSEEYLSPGQSEQSRLTLAASNNENDYGEESDASHNLSLTIKKQGPFLMTPMAKRHESIKATDEHVISNNNGSPLNGNKLNNHSPVIDESKLDALLKNETKLPPLRKNFLPPLRAPNRKESVA